MYDLLIVNGRSASDPKDLCTCYTHNGSSLVAHVLCSRSIIEYIDLRVEDLNKLIHCIITTTLSLKTPTVHQSTTMDTILTYNSQTHIPYRWKYNFREEYETNIDSMVVQTQLYNIYEALHCEQITPQIINTLVIQLSDLIRDASKKCSKHTTQQKHRHDMV